MIVTDFHSSKTTVKMDEQFNLDEFLNLSLIK